MADKSNMNVARSLLTAGMLTQCKAKYKIPDRFNTTLPGPDDRCDRPPPHMTTVFCEHFEYSGCRYPFFNFLFQLLEYFSVPLWQFTPLSLLKVTHFHIMCRSFDFWPSVQLFRFFYKLGRAGDWYSIDKRRNPNPCIFTKSSSSLHNWKHYYFYIHEDFYPVKIRKRPTHLKIFDNPPRPEEVDDAQIDLLLSRASPLTKFDEHVLIMAGLSQNWDLPLLRPYIEKDGKEMDLAAILREGTFNCSFRAVPVVPTGSTGLVRIEGHGESLTHMPVGVVVGTTRALSGVPVNAGTEAYQQPSEAHMIEQFVDRSPHSTAVLGKRKVGMQQVEILEDSGEEGEESELRQRRSKGEVGTLKEHTSEGQQQQSFQDTNFTNNPLNKTGFSSLLNSDYTFPFNFGTVEQPQTKLVDNVGPSRRSEFSSFENLSANLDDVYRSSSHNSEQDTIKRLPEMTPEIANEPFVPGFNKGFQCTNSEDLINYVNSSISLGQQIADRQLTDSALCDRLEADLARSLFSAHELVLRAKQYAANNVKLIGENLEMSKKGIDHTVNAISESKVKELQKQVEQLKGELKDCDTERKKGVRSIAELELEKKKMNDNLEQQLLKFKEKETKFLEDIERLEGVCSESTALKEELEKCKRELELKNAELETGRVNAESEFAALHGEITKMGDRCRSLEEFKKWILVTGLQTLYKRIRSGPEFVSQAFAVNQAMQNYGFQQSLEVGYESCSKNIPVQQVEGYDPEAATKVKEAAYVFQNSESTMLAQIAASSDASLPDIK